ncbi:MAG: SsrA-binding protein SmpB [Chloroflexi bacterium]|nr:SsrA-binding protein SmpB [Chloroflexota bacterium]OQB01100.1 MAG: SsrA-binding protein [Chloroflexi bacterium ADurb.Bin222]HOC22566.1 SsrA-binding protein SmpB [Anaerolineae bacterium]HOS79291.1 SsrA-binding protein SmpB [Anaerolineae bacterium]HQE99933.1 SsrA-binding protein SmpB [Anaerolineae bacterium]
MDDIKIIATNRKAYHDYFIEEQHEAGIALTGTEIKSVRAGQVSLREGYVMARDGELWLMGVHIAPYEQASARQAVDPVRPRKLLLHRREINKLLGGVQEKGYTIVPLRMYLRNRRAKVEIALVKGKKQYDKRATIAKRDAERRIERESKEDR